MIFKIFIFSLSFFGFSKGTVNEYRQKENQGCDQNENLNMLGRVDLEIFLMDFVDFRNPKVYILKLNGCPMNNIIVKSSRYNMLRKKMIDGYYTEIDPLPDFTYKECHENLIITFLVNLSFDEQFFYLGIENNNMRCLEIGMFRWSKCKMKIESISKGYNYDETIFSFKRKDCFGVFIPCFRYLKSRKDSYNYSM